MSQEQPESVKVETVLPSRFVPRVPIVGTLKIGDVQNSKAVKLDHMRLCTASATGDSRYKDHPDMKEFNESESGSLTIELVSDDPRVNLDIVYNMGGNGFIVCRGNGVTADRRMDAVGKISPDAAFRKLPDGTCGEGCAFYQSGKCKLASTLYFRIPGKTAIGSVWQFRTKAWNTAQDLLGAMNSIKQITGGILARIPLTAFMTEQKRRPVVGDKRTTSHFWTLGLAFNGDEESLVAAVGRARGLAKSMAALSMPSLEDRLREQPSDLLRDLPEDEERAFCAEFFPDDSPNPAAQSQTGTGFESPEWADEDLVEAKKQLQDFGEHLFTLGLSEPEVEEELRPAREILGSLDTSYRTWGNRLSGRWERVTKRIQSAKEKPPCAADTP